MSYTLLDRTTPKARKTHKCIWCGESINAGEIYIREKSVYDGDMQNHAWHQECEAACLDEVLEGRIEDFSPYENKRPKETEREIQHQQIHLKSDTTQTLAAGLIDLLNDTGKEKQEI